MKKVSKKLSDHLAKVTELTGRMAQYGDAVPQIETDLLLQALRDMYETVCAMPRPTAAIPTELPQVETDKTEEPVVEIEASPAETEIVVIAAAAATAATAATADAESQPALTMTAEEADLAPLMMDVNAEPQFADDDTITPNAEQTIESAESKEYDDLFANSEELAEEAADEMVIVPEPIEEPVPTLEEPSVATNEPTTPVEESKTLWDKLQQQYTSPTLGEQQGGKSLFDQLTEKAQNGAVASHEAATSAKPEYEAADKPATDIAEPEVAVAATAEAEPIVEVVPEPVKVEATQQQSSLFDILNGSTAKEQPATRTIADNLGGNKAGGIDSKLNSHKVSDLRTIININDKFMFMNELFRNNMKGYNDFIMQLNAISDRAEAQQHVDRIATQYGWDSESLAVQTFYKVFDRKF